MAENRCDYSHATAADQFPLSGSTEFAQSFLLRWMGDGFLDLALREVQFLGGQKPLRFQCQKGGSASEIQGDLQKNCPLGK